MAERLLEVRDLHVHFNTEDGIVRAVDGVSFELDRGKVLGIVGESGSGKSVTAMTLMGLTRDVNTRFEGEVTYKGQNLRELDGEQMPHFGGPEMGGTFPGPRTAMHPLKTLTASLITAV